MDAKDLRLVDRYVQSKHDDGDEDIDALLDEVDDDFMARHREQRIAQLTEEFKRVDRAEGDGELKVETNEKEVIELAALSPRCVIHFFQPQFTACQKMTKLLARFANTHLNVKCIEINVTDAPFLVHKLGIKVLPLVVCYSNGTERVRMLGLDPGDGLGELTYNSLERFMMAHGIVDRASVMRVTKKRDAEDSDESDLDL